MTLLDSLLNLLGYYNLTADEYFAYYGYDYYVPTRKQYHQRLEIADQVLTDVISAEIAGLIVGELETSNEEFKITYDFEPMFTFNGTQKLQAERVMDNVLNDLETKGYKIYETDVDTKFTIKWKFKKFRIFKRTNLGNPPVN